MNTPQFKHDCTECNFLGRDSTGQYDLYYHAHGGPIYRTLIARFSDRGADYKSGLFMVGLVPEITEAHEKAKAQGYIK